VQLHILQTVFWVAIASILIAAVELSIQWNNITDVNDATTTAQLIPIAISLGLAAHVLWIFFVRGQDPEDDGESTSSSVSATA